MKRSKGIQNFKHFVSNMGKNTDLDAENLKNTENSNYQRIFKVPPESITINGGSNENDGNSAPVIKSILYKDSYINTSNENIKSSPLALKMKSALVNAERKLSPRSYESSNYESDDSMTLTSSIKSSKSSRRKHHVTFNETDEIKTYLSDSMSSLDSGASFSEPEPQAPAVVEHVIFKNAYVKQTPLRVSFNTPTNTSPISSTPVSTPGSTPPSVALDTSPIPVPTSKFVVVETTENYPLERTDSWEELRKTQNSLSAKEKASTQFQTDSTDGGKRFAPQFKFKPKTSHSMSKLVVDINKPLPPRPKPIVRNFAPKAKEKPPEEKNVHIPLQNNHTPTLKWEKTQDGDKIQYNAKPKVLAPLPRKRLISTEELSKQKLNTTLPKESPKPSKPICEVVLKEDIAKVRLQNLQERRKNKYLISSRPRTNNNTSIDSGVSDSDNDSVVSSMSSNSVRRGLSRSDSWEELMTEQSSGLPEDDSVPSSFDEETNFVDIQQTPNEVTEKDFDNGLPIVNNEIEDRVSSLLRHKPQPTESQIIKSNRIFSQTLHNENASNSGSHNSIAKESWTELQRKKLKQRQNFFHQSQETKIDPRERLGSNFNTSEPRLNISWKIDQNENKKPLTTTQPIRSRATSLERHLKRVDIPKLNPFEPPSLSYKKNSTHSVNSSTTSLNNTTPLKNNPILNNTQESKTVPEYKINHIGENHLNHNNSNHVPEVQQIHSENISYSNFQDEHTTKDLVSQKIHSNKINGLIDKREIGTNNQILEKEILISDFERNHQLLLENIERVESDISELENHYENHVPQNGKPELQMDLSVRPKTKVNQNSKFTRPTTLEGIPSLGIQNSEIFSDTHTLKPVNGHIQKSHEIHNGINGTILNNNQNKQVISSKSNSVNGTHLTNGKINTVDALSAETVKQKSAFTIPNGSHTSEQSIAITKTRRSVTNYVNGKKVRMPVAEMELGMGQLPGIPACGSSSPTPSDASSSGWSDQSLGSHSSGCFSGSPSPTPSLAFTATPCDLRVTPSPTQLMSPTSKTFPKHPPQPSQMNGNVGMQQMSRFRASAKPTAL